MSTSTEPGFIRDTSSLLTSVGAFARSEEHTSELQSLQYLVCRLLLEKKTTTLFVFSHAVFSLLQALLFYSIMFPIRLILLYSLSFTFRHLTLIPVVIFFYFLFCALQG